LSPCKGKGKPKPDEMTMSQTSTNPALKWILIVIIGMTAFCAVFVVLLATYPVDEYRVARELESRGFRVYYERLPGDKIWKHPVQVNGAHQVITSGDCRLFCQLPRLKYLHFVYCDMSGLILDEIENCGDLQIFESSIATRFPVSELQKLVTCPTTTIFVSSRDVDLNDSDLKEFVKFTYLEHLRLEFNNTEVTDACLHIFEKIPTLKSLRLPGSSITQEGIEEFKKKRPDVVVAFE